MKKKTLIKIVKECCYEITFTRINDDREEFDRKMQSLNNFSSLIDAALMFCPDDFNLDGLSSLERFASKESLKAFIGSSSFEDIEIQLNAVLTELKTLANAYAGQNTKKIVKTATALSKRNDWLNEIQDKNHKVIYPIFIIGFIIFSISIVVFAVLDAGAFFPEGTPMSKACAIITAVAGALDVINGIAFFVYERMDDKKKKENQSELETAICGKRIVKNSNNKIKAGKGSVVRIGDSKSAESAEDLLDAYIIKNSNNNIRAKKNSEIRIGDD